MFVNIDGVHPDLIAVLSKAATLSRTRFCVVRGRITQEQAKELVRAKMARTENLRNVTGHAVNVIPLDQDGNPVPYGQCFGHVADAVLLAAHELAIPVDWGGWSERDPDMSQFELRWDVYPADWGKGPFRM